MSKLSPTSLSRRLELATALPQPPRKNPLDGDNPRGRFLLSPRRNFAPALPHR